MLQKLANPVCPTAYRFFVSFSDAIHGFLILPQSQ